MLSNIEQIKKEFEETTFFTGFDEVDDDEYTRYQTGDELYEVWNFIEIKLTQQREEAVIGFIKDWNSWATGGDKILDEDIEAMEAHLTPLKESLEKQTKVDHRTELEKQYLKEEK